MREEMKETGSKERRKRKTRKRKGEGEVRRGKRREKGRKDT